MGPCVPPVYRWHAPKNKDKALSETPQRCRVTLTRRQRTAGTAVAQGQLCSTSHHPEQGHLHGISLRVRPSGCGSFETPCLHVSFLHPLITVLSWLEGDEPLPAEPPWFSHSVDSNVRRTSFFFLPPFWQGQYCFSTGELRHWVSDKCAFEAL